MDNWDMGVNSGYVKNCKKIKSGGLPQNDASKTSN